MDVFRNPQKAGKSLHGPVVAIGNFDGVHLGHRKVFFAALTMAKELGVPWAPMTFDPHPAKVLAPGLAPQLITTMQDRLALIEESGPAATIVMPFDEEIASLTPRQYAQEILKEKLKVSGVVVGYDFTFGSNRDGKTEDLERFGREMGFRVAVVDAFSVGGMVVSSTKIRAFVLSGRVYAASLLLGRPLILSGEVVHGDGRGASLGFPTANVDVEQELNPAPGVYAAWCCWDDHQYPAAINVGSVPTFRTNGRTTVEAFILDWSGDLYGKHVNVDFIRRLRPEVRYDSAEELVAQIKKDVRRTRETLMKL